MAERRPDPLFGADAGRGWHLAPRRRHLIRAGVVAVVLMLLTSTWQVLRSGHPLAPAFVVISVLVVVAAWPAPRGGQRPVPVELDHERGLLLPVRRPLLRRLVLWVVLTCVFTIMGVAAPVLAIRDRDLEGIPATLAMMLLAGGFGTFAWGSHIKRRFTSPGLLLTPTHVHLRTRVEPAVVAWADVAAVEDHWRRWGRGFTSVGDRINNWLTFRLHAEPAEPDRLSALSGSPHPAMDPADLAVDPELALRLLRFYLDHPEARRELAGETALARWDGLARSTAAP